MKMVYEIRVQYSSFREYEKDSAIYEKEGFTVARVKQTKKRCFKVTYVRSVQ